MLVPNGGIDLSTHITHVHLDHVVGPGVVGVPDVLQHLVLGDDGVHVPHEEFQDAVLTRRQLDGGGVTLHDSPRRVECQRARGQNDGAVGRSAPKKGAQACQEDDECHRLGEIVVSAEVERVGLVVVTILGGQHEHWRPDFPGAHSAKHLVAV